MSPDVRRQAFDPFFTTRRHQGGAGLGLHIVYSVGDGSLLGGQLRLSSEPGEGTDVRIVLPRQIGTGRERYASHTAVPKIKRRPELDGV